MSHYDPLAVANALGDEHNAAQLTKAATAELGKLLGAQAVEDGSLTECVVVRAFAAGTGADADGKGRLRARAALKHTGLVIARGGGE